MIIYYHCTRDSALLLSFFTNLPSLHPMRNKTLTTPMYANASRLEIRVEVRDCAKFVKVVIEKVDDRNAERIMRTEILDRFVMKSPLTEVPVIS